MDHQIQSFFTFYWSMMASMPTIRGSRKEYLLQVDVTTSTLAEHNSFDYEATLAELSHTISSQQHFSLDIASVHILRNENTFEVTFLERESLFVGEMPQNRSHLGAFEIRYVNKNIILRFYELDELLSHRKYGPANSKAIANKEIHQVYCIVRSFKNEQQESVGCKLRNNGGIVDEGGFLKIGQKEYFLSSICTDKSQNRGDISEKIMLVDSIVNSGNKELKASQHPQKGECKYCMMEQGEGETQFLCTPCKCSGSCGMVHFSCLQKWNQSKVKKNRVKGLTYYNFEKFYCEVCMEEYPKVISRAGKNHELMPIDFPKGEHLILEEVEVKNAGLICVEEIPQEGIRIGRGNECEIKVDNPSISRNHARIVRHHGEYVVFDNKSKFGTLIKDPKIYLQVDLTRKGLQIDRTVLMFSLIRRQQ